jgi:hypothetical protein
VAANIAVYGLYNDRAGLHEAVNTLKEVGFRETDISFLFPENQRFTDFVRAPEGAVLGGGSLAIVGGAFGWVAGIGMLPIPSIGSFVAAGPVIGMLAGIGIGGTVGAVIGGLFGTAMPDSGILLSVHCDSLEWVQSAKEILRETGADDVASASEASAEFPVSDKIHMPAAPVHETAVDRKILC